MNTRKAQHPRAPLIERFETERSARRCVHAAMAGTFDVSNFGDLLFPLVAEFELTKRLKDLDLKRYSYRQMDEKRWTYSVSSLGELAQQVSKLDLLLIGGGHLVRFDKLVAPGYEPTEGDLHHPTGYWLMPTLLGLVCGVPVAWNCVGVSSDTPGWARRLLALAVDNTPYISVRDELSARELHAVSTRGKIRIVPDTAFGIQSLLPQQPSARFISFCATAGLKRPYVIVQASRQLQGFTAQVSAALSEARASGCQILELPISPVLGDAAGVLDLEGKIAQAKAWPEPLLIAELIANAEAVIAQSLHLTIVALSVGVPVHRPRSGEGSKYAQIEHIDGVHLWDPGVDAAVEMRRGLGKRLPGVRITEIQAQLSSHWDRIAELSRQRTEPHPEILVALANECVKTAEENSTQPLAKHNGLSQKAHEGSSSAENGEGQIGRKAAVDLNQRFGELEARAESAAAENARMRGQFEQQEAQMRALVAKTKQLEAKIDEIATEARDQLQRQEAYYALIARVRSIVRETLPAHSTVAVVSNGEDQFVSFGGHTGWHFPRTDAGLYAGRHPTNSAEAIAELDKQRFQGAQYLLFPETSFWWFDSYPELASHLKTHYRLVLNREDTCRIYSLRERS